MSSNDTDFHLTDEFDN